jgi:hypothetical protein
MTLHEGTQGLLSTEVMNESDEQVISCLEHISFCDYNKILLLLS